MNSKHLRKITHLFAIFLIFAFFMNLTISVKSIDFDNTVDIEELGKARNFLLSNGWTNDEIDDYLDNDTLLQYANAEYVVNSEKKYYRVTNNQMIEVTEEECLECVDRIHLLNADISNLSVDVITNQTNEDDYIKKKTVETYDGYMIYYVSSYWVGDGFILSSRFEWLTNPVDRDWDVLGILTSEFLNRDNSFDVYFIYKADKMSNGVKVDEYSSGYYSKQQNTNGVAVIFDLKGGNNYQNHRGFLQFKSVIGVSGAIYWATARYYHQKGFFDVVPSVTLSGDLVVTASWGTKMIQMTPSPYITFE